jgi:hypothetical protein
MRPLFEKAKELKITLFVAAILFFDVYSVYDWRWPD